ncbi:tyrosine-type recombinase/integrase [Tunturiibacter gelidiferens]|uniref:tyrosine-type recombinase/integrase n=1 Tax=Tunturiibacter gelidiferens TaxID=3069689 RepID=UPI003D9B8F0F
MLAASANRLHRTMLMTLFSTGVRRTELCQLKTSDIDSKRMVVHVRQGKGRRDRDVPLSPALLEELRGYWRWMKPKTYLFPGVVDGWRADVPISDKTVWFACQSVARAAGIEKHISPIACATATRLTCLKQGWTCARSRCCSAMLRSITPPSISTSPGGIWTQSRTRSIPFTITASAESRRDGRLSKR